jgi:lysophospholipase L1-like esterase
MGGSTSSAQVSSRASSAGSSAAISTGSSVGGGSSVAAGSSSTTSSSGGVDPGLCARVGMPAGAIVASHCRGTNHQDITGVQRVVFVGDSITVGTPPTPSASYYRTVLSDQLAARFALQAPSATWKASNPLNGMPGERDSGDFCASAKWGARTDDLMEDNTQLEDCLPLDQRNKTTLVVMTMGGNDIFAIAEARAAGQTEQQVQALLDAMVLKQDQALAWLKEPGRFPNGIFVIFTNNYEFTDRTGDVENCPGAAQAGYNATWGDTAGLPDAVAWANARYIQMAVARGVDMVFMEEAFCGHGFSATQPQNVCHNPSGPNYFDLTCFHPNASGHADLASAFLAVVTE